MSIFGDLVSGVLKGALGQGESGAVPNILSQLLARTDLGNVGGLLAKLQEAGLGGQVGSWLGNGTNLPISPDQLRSALGDGQLQQLARAAGLPVDQLLGALSQHLPQAVDNMSQNGALEESESEQQQDDSADQKASGQEQEEPSDENTSGEQQGGSLADQAGLNDIKP